jgi:hypothetical protein
VFSTVGFARVFFEKRLELKSLKGQTNAEEEEGPPGPFLLSLRLPLKALYMSLIRAVGSLIRAVSQKKLGQNGGTEGAPWGDGPSL